MLFPSYEDSFKCKFIIIIVIINIIAIIIIIKQSIYSDYANFVNLGFYDPPKQFLQKDGKQKIKVPLIFETDTSGLYFAVYMSLYTCFVSSIYLV